MAIIVKNMMWTSVGRHVQIGKRLTKKEQKLIKNQIEKFLRNKYSVISETLIR